MLLSLFEDKESKGDRIRQKLDKDLSLVQTKKKIHELIHYPSHLRKQLPRQIIIIIQRKYN